MSKATILDRLAGAMKTLSKREGKALTPRQRVAAAQRFESLGHLADNRLNEYRDTFGMDFLKCDRRHATKNGLDNADYGDELWGFMDLGLIDENRPQDIARNPFLSKNPTKYDEQSEFLDWCRYNRVEPNARSLKQFRWETYKTLPYRERQWIANKDDMLEMVGPEDPEEFRNARTLRDWDAASKEWMGGEWDMQDLPVYKSLEEFPDDFDYMWRY